MGKRLKGFVPRPGLIPEVDGNCSGGRENRQGCVKECLKVEKANKTFDLRGLRIKSSKKSHGRRAPLSDLPKILAVHGFKAMGTPGCSDPLAFGGNGC
jgi:hypothetical protein